MSIDINVKRADKTYFPEENVVGVVRLSVPNDFKHDGIILTMEGSVNLQISSKNVGIIGSFSNSVKPIQLLSAVCEITSGGKIPAGITEIPFEIPLKAKTNRTLYETYHGVYVNISYTLKCDIKRSFLSKDIQKSQEFLVQNKHSILPSIKENRPVDINITPTSVVGAHTDTPDFHLEGRLYSTYCNISKPFNGYLRLRNCSIPVKSLEIQLIRVETCGCAEGFARESTEIQNIQVGDGDIPLNTEIPIFMIFPRLFTCPTLIEHYFRIEFAINIVIIFENDHLVTNNFPIILYRE